MESHFRCPPTSGNPHATALEFTWDPEAGTVTGPGAAVILEIVAAGEVKAHPLPCSPWTLGPDPLRSWRDMAAIVGSEWRLPDKLQPHYPQLDNGGDPNVYDDERKAIDQVTY